MVWPNVWGFVLDPVFSSTDLYVWLCASTSLFDYCRFVVNFEIKKYDSSGFVLFQDICCCCCYSRSLKIPYEF